MVNSMRLLHDSRDPAYRTPTGAQPCGALVHLCLRVVEGGAPDVVTLRAWFGKESFLPMRPHPDDRFLYTADIIMPEMPCLLWYDFQVWKDGQFYWYGNAEDGLGGVGALVYGQARSYQITVYDPAFCTPQWLSQTVFYQIFPDRYAKDAYTPLPPIEERTLHANWNEQPLLQVDASTGDNIAHDFFGGTLRGIQEKLPYIASLGCNAIYLNPIFHASTNHRFDTNDWHQIDPYLGTEEDFIHLCQAAEALHIRIILDGVFSHAGSNSPIFQSAQTDAASPYRHWFLFDHWPDDYKSWWGFRTLPEMDKYHPDVIDYFLTGKNAVVPKWLLAGAAGWRIDVADELPMSYLRTMRNAVKRTNPDALILGEVWEDASNKISYGQMRSYCLGDTLDGVMNYPLRDTAIDFLLERIDAYVFKRKIDSLYENYPPPFARGLLNLLGSHDRPRILNTLAEQDGESLPRTERAALRLSDDELALGRSRVKLLLQLIVAMPGMPCVYYGDEIGMQGAADPFNRSGYTWDHIDDPLRAFFSNTLAMRKESVTLAEGDVSIQAINANVLRIRRTTDTYEYTVMINRSKQPELVVIDGQPVILEKLSYRADPPHD